MESMWEFHFKSLETLRPGILAVATNSIGMSLTTMWSNDVVFLVLKFMWGSFYFVLFSWNLSAKAPLTRVSMAAWIWLSWFLLIVSKMVVSSRYFQRFMAGASSLLIMMMNSHSPNFVPWGAPIGTTPHSEKQWGPSLTGVFVWSEETDDPRDNRVRDVI